MLLVLEISNKLLHFCWEVFGILHLDLFYDGLKLGFKIYNN